MQQVTYTVKTNRILFAAFSIAKALKSKRLLLLFKNCWIYKVYRDGTLTQCKNLGAFLKSNQ